MKINSIQLNNFKCFEDRTFAFGPRIEISGRNGSGKTSLREAVLFCLYNRTETAVKETDKYIRNGADFCEVVINTGAGMIKRQRGKSKSKVWLNDSETTQENLADKLKLPEFTVFNSVFTAGYFMSLPEKDQRQIILDLTEPVDRRDIYNKLGGKKTTDYEIDLEDIDGTCRKINARNSEIAKKINGHEAVTNEILATQEKLRDAKACPFCFKNMDDKTSVREKLEEEIAKHKGEIAKLEESRVDTKDIVDLLKKIPQEEIKIKLEMIEANLQIVIPGIKIALMEILKTQIGYRPVFKLCVNGKEHRFLSTGEKKMVDVGLCGFLNKFYKLDMVFVDNMESISGELPINFSQVFTSRVINGELRVEII